MIVYVADFVLNGDIHSEALPDSVWTPPSDILKQKTEALIVQAQGNDIFYTFGGVDPDPGASPPVGYRILADTPEVRIPIINLNDPPRFRPVVSGAIIQATPIRYSYRK